MIVGNKVNLTSLYDNDFNKILEWVNQPELKSLTGTLYPVSDIEHRKWFERKRLSDNEKIFGIRDKNNELYGIIGIKNIDFISQNAELYIYIGEMSMQGNGFGSDAIKTLLSFCFNSMNLHKIYLTVFSHNHKAIQLYQKLGFKKEGILKEHRFMNGDFTDVLIFSYIKESGIV